ncbi:MAG TPA: bifunctional diguanylate cyclase/phosphodiesterase, partial [Hansschlegelia sp.]
HGHAAGYALIAHAATSLQGSGAGGYAARIGGDEYLLVPAETDSNAVEKAMEALLDRIATTDDRLPRICASVGIARLSIDSPDAESWWRKADIAMREAKARGRGQAVFFHPRMSAAIASRKALGDEIETALERDEFALFYQPQVGLASGRLIGFEAFLRWQHPTRGLLLPDVFIEAATERGLIDALTRQVFERVCEQIGRWQRIGGFPDVPVSVNISGQQFHDRRLPAVVASSLMRSGLPARLLVLEIIEKNFLIDEADTERVVKELARLGVRVSIGSFGLGHVSLRSLRTLGVSQIKLNRNFVEGLPDDAESAIVVEAAIGVARRLKCQVIAEGVETRAQFERLRELGCEAAQGFFLGAPLSPGEIEPFVAANREHPVR